MSEPQCYGLDPEYTEAELAEMEEREGEEMAMEPDAAPDPVPDRRDNNRWCRCGNCPVMATEAECLCCRELEGCTEIQPEGCFIDSDEFRQVCLARVVLRVFHIARRDIRGHRPVVPAVLENKPSRFAAYKLFTYLIHGILGKGVRKVVPACVVTRLRQEYPEASGVYIGFKHGNDGEMLEVPEQMAI